MKRFTKFFLTLVIFVISGCNLPNRQPTGVGNEALLVVTPVITETSPFGPVMTQTATATAVPQEQDEPFRTEGPSVTPTPGLTAGLAYEPPESGQAATITQFNMVNLQTGWGASAALERDSSGSLLRTTDSGTTWSVITPPSGYPEGSRFFALDEQHAWAVPAVFPAGDPEPQDVEAGYVWRTSDGGETWNASTPIHPNVQEGALLESFFPHDLYFLDPQSGWLVVSVGHYMNQDVFVLLRTEDGGLTWEQLTDKFSMSLEDGPGAPCRISGVAFTNPQRGIMTGDCLDVGVDDGFSILVTEDGGFNWRRQEIPTPQEAQVLLQDSDTGNQQTCAPTGVERTPAGLLVQHTCRVQMGAGDFGMYFFLSLGENEDDAWLGWAGETASFASTTVGYSLGRLTGEGQRVLSRTTDGGQSWSEAHTVTWPEARLDFPDASQGFALAWRWDEESVQTEYALVRTENEGGVWSLVEGSIK